MFYVTKHIWEQRWEKCITLEQSGCGIISHRYCEYCSEEVGISDMNTTVKILWKERLPQKWDINRKRCLFYVKTILCQAVTLLGCCVTYVGSCLPTFRNSLSVTSSRVMLDPSWPLKTGLTSCPKTLLNSCQYMLWNIQEWRRPQWHRGGSQAFRTFYVTCCP